MKNVRRIYVHIAGDVFAHYDLSAEPLTEGKYPTHTLEVLSQGDKDCAEKLQSLLDAGLVCYPNKYPHIAEGVNPRRNSTQEYFYSNGERTKQGVIYTVKKLVFFLEEVASEVWSNIDPRCGARIPSRLYRNTAYICADALCRLGIPAKVTSLELDPAIHNGLKHQYRVVVDVGVPAYPWKEKVLEQTESVKRVELEPSYERINFDFDVTNALRIKWVWPNTAHVVGNDTRVLWDGRPNRWVGGIALVARDGYSRFTIQSDPSHPIGEKGEGDLLLRQTSLLTVLQEVSDGTEEGMLTALQSMLSTTNVRMSARGVVTPMNLG